MHVVETYFECGGFDHRFIQGGTSVYLWNLARTIAEQGHRVSIVTPAHGRVDDLRAIPGFTELDYSDSYELPLTLDRRTWPDFPEHVRIPLTTRAYQLTLAGVDLYFLSNEMLDQLPDRFYPPYESKGSNLVFFKGVAYQVGTVRFIRARLLDGADDTEPLLVHAHEPYYHYLMPAAFRADPQVRVVGTVQSNMPITKSEYAPLVRELLDFLDAPVALPPPDPAPPPELTPMIQYQQRTHLHYAYPPDYVRIYDLVAQYADRVSFLSPGHLHFYDTFAGTPFEPLFNRLPVAATVRDAAATQFVGGCAIGDDWLSDTEPADRDAVLSGLGLDPALPTFFHNARYAVHHKGQVELARAVGQALDEGVAANFVLRMVTDTPITHPVVVDLVRRHAAQVYLETARVPDARIRDYASSSQFCLFPSKFEMDTFLIAMGEAMARGAVPIATAQEGMEHFGHLINPFANPAHATGFAVRRSFTEDDPLLVEVLVAAIHRAVRLHRDDPVTYARLSAAAVSRARSFTWSRCAATHIAEFEKVLDGRRATLDPRRALHLGWFDAISDDWVAANTDAVAAAALAVGDLSAYRRCRPVDRVVAARLFDVAMTRADTPAAARIARAFPEFAPRLAARFTVRDGMLCYRLRGVQRAELVLAASSANLRAPADVQPLVAVDQELRVPLPEDVRWPLHLLLTLESGATRWDVLRRD